jgi:hypothetical protein
MSKSWYEVKNIEDFVNSARKLVFRFFDEENAKPKPNQSLDSELYQMSKEELDELDQTLPYNESFLIAQQHMKQKNKKNEIIKYYITDEILYTIIEELNSRMVSNILHHLVNRGMLESGYDAEAGDFIFWIKEEENDKKQKPEAH